MFSIAQNRWVRIQKKRMLFLSLNIVQYTTRANSREGIRHIFIAARLLYMGIKISPSKLISSGLDIHLALDDVILHRCLAVTKIRSIFVTAKRKRNYFCVTQIILIILVGRNVRRVKLSSQFLIILICLDNIVYFFRGYGSRSIFFKVSNLHFNFTPDL